MEELKILSNLFFEINRELTKMIEELSYTSISYDQEGNILQNIDSTLPSLLTEALILNKFTLGHIRSIEIKQNHTKEIMLVNLEFMMEKRMKELKIKGYVYEDEDEKTKTKTKKKT